MLFICFIEPHKKTELQDNWTFSWNSKLLKPRTLSLLLLWHWVLSFKSSVYSSGRGWLYWNNFLNQRNIGWWLYSFAEVFVCILSLSLSLFLNSQVGSWWERSKFVCEMKEDSSGKNVCVCVCVLVVLVLTDLKSDRFMF